MEKHELRDIPARTPEAKGCTTNPWPVEKASSWAKLCASGICQATLSCAVGGCRRCGGVGECLLVPINVPDVVEAVGRLLHAASPPDLAAR